MYTANNLATDIYIRSLCDRATEPTGTTIEGGLACETICTVWQPVSPMQSDRDDAPHIYTSYYSTLYSDTEYDNVHNAAGSAIHIIINNYCFDGK